MSPLALARLLDGGLLLALPDAVRRAAGIEDSDAARVARVLGARQLVQAGLTLRRPSAAALRIGSGVDALHGASMFALGVLDPARRRPALTSAGVALTFALAGGLAAERAA